MAPGRKKGANKAKAKKQLSLGDLVLAKVKGHPAWPAKISRPEDWDKAPDPKKYFVHFFGTGEICYISADIQIFNNDVKNKLSARCQGKTGKSFSQAVKEISVAFEDLQKRKLGGLGDDVDESALGCEGPSADGLDDRMDVDLNDGSHEETSDEGTGDFNSKLDSHSNREGETDDDVVKPSPLFNGEEQHHTSLASDIDDGYHVKVENADDVKYANCAKKVGNSTLMNGHKSKMLGTDSKRRLEGADEGSGSTGVKSLKDSIDVGGKLEDGVRGEIAGVHCAGSSPVAVKSESGMSSGKKSKKPITYQKGSRVCQGSNDSVVKLPPEISNRKTGLHPRPGSSKFEACDTSHPAKKSKFVDVEDGAAVRLSAKNLMNHASRSTADEKSVKDSDGKREILLALRAQTGKDRSYVPLQASKDKSDFSLQSDRTDLFSPTVKAKSDASAEMIKVKADISGDEAVLPVTKRHRRALEAMLGSTSLNSDDRIAKSSLDPKNVLSSGNAGATVHQLPKRRRAVCLYGDDDEDEEPKTPVHGGSGRVSREPRSMSDTIKKKDANVTSLLRQQHVGVINTEKNIGASFGFERSRSKETSWKIEMEHLPSKDSKPISTSPRQSPRLFPATKSIGEHHEPVKPVIKVSSIKGLQPSSSKVSGHVSDCLNTSYGNGASQMNRPALSGERPKTTPKAPSRISADLLETSAELQVGMEDRSGWFVESKTPDSAMSMKHLIAAAQAKRKLAHSQQFSLGNLNSSLIFANDVHGSTLSPSLVQPFLSETSNLLQGDMQGIHHHANLVSPSTHARESSSHNQLENEETEERRLSSGQRAGGGSLSGGTEAAVARDAFEGMVETLSRTKESIGRVVELLIRKLETEPSFHRKVDLFFLVDSITQCSHNQKGIAGASYVPTVQAALPRLLGAAAPAGASARENRRQCLKVLRLWLERKVLPESALRRYIDDFGVSNDDTSVGLSLRRPSRAERAVDDPIREMEGMLVDEYGSNATFQLPGLLSCSILEDDEDDFPSSLSKEEADAQPVVEPISALQESDTSTIAGIDRRHCILEDVDGELEMEDVSGNEKDDTSSHSSGSVEMETQQQSMHGLTEPALNNSMELAPLPEGSPPLPPILLRLPTFASISTTATSSSIPITTTTSTSTTSVASTSCLTATTTTTPSTPPPPPSLLPPPPSIPSEPPPHVLSMGALPPMVSQASVPIQPTVQPQSGNQMITMPGNSTQGNHIDGVVKSELFPQHFTPSSVCNQEPTGFSSSRQLEYGQNGTYMNPQASQANPHFQPGNPPFLQRPPHPNLPQNTTGHFPFTNPAIQQHPQQVYPHPYNLSSLPDSRRQFVPEDQWRMPPSDFNTNNHHGAWMNGRTPSHAGPPFGQEGYFRPPIERPVANNMSFPPSATNSLPSGAPIPGHGASPMLPCRPDMSALNCWRPS
ncbi:hypothetical protein K2173_010067 [Erythroxylum novogranatense]|uniref:Uncharacterized protein n=1 Tax=Erythroxylum novogranatense TaxID=1862640 RepID=A0AAV8SZL9_9ROSI|nr:hypothetical protein K2173_010067 [Erythroxylum novogranatense]